MIKTLELRLKPSEATNTDLIHKIVCRKLKVSSDHIFHIEYVRRSIDARFAKPKINLRLKIFLNEHPKPEVNLLSSLKDVSRSQQVLIIGAGPAGYFAALQCIESGLKPVVIDRGKDVQARRKDLRAIQQFSKVDPDSNYCFGEGGAGTYSDGKLYTRSTKRGNHLKVLKILVEHGARPDILIDAHPHIGSNKLPKIIANIRHTILEHGGEIHFNSRIVDFLIQDKRIKGVKRVDGKEFLSLHVILATGHSARDIFKLLHKRGLRIENKEFALGVRIEHPQILIDECQYNQRPRDAALPAAAYRLAHQVNGTGVFSFCMCPGGLIVPAATAPGEIVVNGMSLSRRDSAFANSGVVSQVTHNDLGRSSDQIFAGLTFQQSVEQGLFHAGDGSQKAPAQRLTDFLERKNSQNLNDCSYIPGIYSAPLHELLPEGLYQRLRQGILGFEKRMKGYISREANVVAPESRTSSPVRIPRDPNSFMHPDLKGLYPCGEGAGYAGGILSAAMDGQNVAKAIKRNTKAAL